MQIMAKTFGIQPSQRRSHRAFGGETTTTSLPPVSHARSSRNINVRNSSKTSGIIEAVNKEKWTFLQRLLAIEEKHEQRKQAKQKEFSNNNDNVTSQMKDKAESRILDLENNRFSRGMWISDQILDDNTGPDNDGDGGDYDNDDYNNKNNTNNRYSNNVYHPHDSSLRDSRQNKDSLPVITLPSIHHDASQNYRLQDSESPSHSIVLDPDSPRHIASSEESMTSRTRRKRPLRLPPILLPPIYTVRPRPLQEREFLTPTRIPGPITDEEWEDLYNCRYIRHATPKYALQLSPSQSSFYF